MKGYMGDQAASDALFDAEGYCRTGDIGYYDRDGFFFIVDRLKELIKYKGFQVILTFALIMLILQNVYRLRKDYIAQCKLREMITSHNDNKHD